MDFKNLSRADIEKLRKSKDEKVQRAGEILALISSDLESRMYASITGVVEAICKDLDSVSSIKDISIQLPSDDNVEGLIAWRDLTKGFVAGTGILGGDKDDKLFERVNAFMKNYSDYVKAIATGKARLEQIGGTEKTEKASEDFFMKKAKERNGNTQQKEE